MSLHRIRSIAIGVPDVEPVRAFYRDFGLTETAPRRFATADGGEQLRLERAPRRTLLALGVGVDDADDLGRAATALAGLGLPSERDASGLEAVEPATGTPRSGGIAPKPPKLLSIGDLVRVEIDGLGTLENRVVAEPDTARR
jgi:catechol 2,3-dioxygenase-like lactoylglutathione lyase family enzyme